MYKYKCYNRGKVHYKINLRPSKKEIFRIVIIFGLSLWIFCSAVVQYFRFFQIISMKGLGNGYDYEIYEWAYMRWLRGGNIYESGFNYFPSFFLLFQYIYGIKRFFWFCFICYLISIPLLLKMEINPLIKVGFLLLPFSEFYAGNISPFFIPITYLCILLREKEGWNTYFIPILLAIISIKPTIIWIVILFWLFYTDNKFYFILMYGGVFLLLNFNLTPNLLFQLLDYVFHSGSHYVGFDNIIQSGTCSVVVYYITFKDKLLSKKK